LFGVLGRGRTDMPVDFGDPSTPPFWALVYKHRKFVNDRITSQPPLLDTVYSFMASCPSILRFQVRFKLFANKMRHKRSRSHFSVNVRRDHVLIDSFEQLRRVNLLTWLGFIHIAFTNEPGIDGGGLLREWFSCLTCELFNPAYTLFLPTLSERSFQPNPASAVNANHLDYFQFAGKIFALAVLNSVHLSAHLSIPFLKRIIGRPVSLEDLEDIDEMLFMGMKWVLENSVSDLPSELTFTTSAGDLGNLREIDLLENGSSIAVTNENKAEYVNLMVEYRLRRGIENQGNAFCNGFYELISQEELRLFDAHELDLVICGENRIDVDDWQQNCEFQGIYYPSHPVIKLFFTVIRAWSQENLSRLLAFTTGSPQVPLGGFAAFREAGKPIVINQGGGKERLVTAHTCVNTLDLPLYENTVEMNQKLMYAIDNCTEYGFR
jgi:E3 ubiquitin-protein ligase HUWE1